MAVTRPTATSCNFTLASGFMTNPARSEMTVTVTVVARPPRNNVAAKTNTPAMAMTVVAPTIVREVLLVIFIDLLCPYPDRLKLPSAP
jgi:hypothetical protein